MSGSGDVYLPDLGKCIAGEVLVGSWNEIFFKLLQQQEDQRWDPFSTFLTCRTSQSLLDQPLARFPPPSPESKSSLETRTAAINVSPSPANISILQELKEDALWLSQKTNTDEVESLRMAVLEWQRRPKAELQDGFSETELTSLRDALGPEYDGQAAFLHYSDSAVSRLGPGAKRHFRLMDTFLKERTGLLGTSKGLMQACLVKAGLAPSGITRHHSNRKVPGPLPPGLLDSFFPHLREASTRRDQVIYYIEAIQRIWDGDFSNLNWAEDETLQERLSKRFFLSNARECLILMDIILLHIRTSISLLKTDAILSWFKCMNSCNFLADLAVQPSTDLSLSKDLQASAAIVTVAILDPETSVGLALKGIDKETLQSPATDISYFLDFSVASEIHAVLCQAAFAALPHVLPAILAWGLILYAVRDVGHDLKTERETRVQRAIDQGNPESQTGRRSSSGSIGSIQQTVYEEVLDQLAQQFDDPPIEFMIESSIANDGVFEMISALANANNSSDSLVSAFRFGALQDLVKMALPIVKYSAEILGSQLAILDPVTTDADTFLVTRQSTVGSATLFIHDDFLIQDLFETSAARFPFEAVPFLRLCGAMLCADTFLESGLHYVTHRLKNMTSFTNEASVTRLAFHTIREEENANLVCLEQDLCMIGQNASQKSISQYSGEAMIANWVPAGVIGEVISEAPPSVIRWFHSYSALALLGAWLDLHRSDQLAPTLPPQSTNVVVSEVITLLGGVLLHILPSDPTQRDEAKAQEVALSLLDEISSGYAHDDDIVTVIFDIFEAQLQALRYHLDRDGASEVLVACIRFLVVIIKILPDRVWRGLFRSSLVGMRENEGTLLLIIGSAATHPGASLFFEACTLMYDFLVDDCLSHVKSNIRTEPTDRLRKHTTQISSPVTIPTDLMSSQLSSLTRAMMETLESTSGSVWNCPAQKHRINRNLFASFNKILSYTYGADDNSNLQHKLTSVLAPSAVHIAQLYRGGATSGTSVIPPLRCILGGVREPDVLADDNASRALQEGLVQSLSLCSSLIRLGRISGIVSSLEKQLLDMTPVFIRLPETHPDVTSKSLRLMEAMLSASADSPTASLLGHLGSDSSRNFLELLRSYAIVGVDVDVKISAWGLARHMMRKNQHWFAVMLLTGSSPSAQRSSNEATDSTTDHSLRGTPLFGLALNTLSSIELVEEQQVVAMLQFIAIAQENWVWAQNILQSHAEFLPCTIAYVSQLSFGVDSLQQSHQSQIASLVSQISTVRLYQARSTRDLSAVKTILPLLTWLSKNAIEVESYNASLHANLRRNFTARYAPFTMNNLKRTAFSDLAFGHQYFYDIDLAAKMVFPDQSQSGTSSGLAGQSFADELRRANLNLSLVQSQLYLLQSFKALCVEHASSFMQDREIQKVMVHIIQRCVKANTRACPPERIFDTLFLTRADFALALIQPLVEIKAKGSDTASLLESIWECLRFGNATFESAILSDSLKYYRTNLSLLLFGMQFHVHRAQRARSNAAEARPSTPTSLHSYDSIILEIVSLGLAEGLETVVRSLSDQHQKVGSMAGTSDNEIVGVKDIQLLLNILQSILRLPTIAHLTSQVSQYLSSSSVLQACARLYSWSHVLTSPELGDIPIYAELSLQFLASLSSLPAIAEELAVEGVLTIISTSRITQSLRSRPGGVAQFDKQPHFQTLYRAWASGIIPICLNLLHSVGRAMAGEVAAFLNQFPQQLSRASNSFAVPTGDRLGTFGPISLEMAQEATTLALISHVLLAYRRAGASAGVDGWEVSVLSSYDENKKDLTDDMEDLLANNHKHLKARIVPVSETERAWQNSRDGNILERKIVEELRAALVCLRSDVEADMP